MAGSASKGVVIVESPAKAKTIEGYLGKGFSVRSSYGHVRDLPKNGIAVDVANGFEPTYEVSSDKKKVLSELKKVCKRSSAVYLATDDDREGEAISWHLVCALGLEGDSSVRRIVFREITKKAVLRSLDSPRQIDLSLVEAQQARRVLDRLVGFELSPLLWKKVKQGLSAGRVQSVATRLVVDREQEIQSFEQKNFFSLEALFDTESGVQIRAKHPDKLSLSEVESFLSSCNGASFSVAKVEKKPAFQSPSAPFTTSTLQQEASRRLGFSVARTMACAQRLYEAGKISYMRTDSVTLSEEALQQAQAEVTRLYGREYVSLRRYRSKSRLAQEAHEAIRPTDFSIQAAGKDAAEKRLYQLIWRRALASQMSKARLSRTTMDIAISTLPDDKLCASGEVIEFDGFLRLYDVKGESEAKPKGSEEVSQQKLPDLPVGTPLEMVEMEAREQFTRPPARYTEASLVKKLDDMGIGRPSTYAPTIDTIQKRNYVVKESREGLKRKYKHFLLTREGLVRREKVEVTGAEKNKLFPTDTAVVVNDFLLKNFSDILDYSFTAKIEEELDEIAEGKLAWRQMVGVFYKHFHPKVEESEKGEVQANKVRELGTDPRTGQKVYAKLGKYGPYIQVGENLSEQNPDKPKYASLLSGQSLQTISLEEALDLCRLPREVGRFESEAVMAAAGRYGPYLKHKSKFYTLPKTLDPVSVSLEQARKVIEDKRAADKNRIMKTFAEDETLFVLRGRYGPYLKHGKKNYKIPKRLKPEELSYDDCLGIIGN